MKSTQVRTFRLMHDRSIDFSFSLSHSFSLSLFFSLSGCSHATRRLLSFVVIGRQEEKRRWAISSAALTKVRYPLTRAFTCERWLESGSTWIDVTCPIIVQGRGQEKPPRRWIRAGNEAKWIGGWKGTRLPRNHACKVSLSMYVPIYKTYMEVDIQTYTYILRVRRTDSYIPIRYHEFGECR